MAKHRRRRPVHRRRARWPSLLLLVLTLLALTAALTLRLGERTAERAVPLPEGAATRSAMADLNATLIDTLNQMISDTPHETLEIVHPADDGVLVTNWRDIVAVSAVGALPLEQVFGEMVAIVRENAAADGAVLFPSADGTLYNSPTPVERVLRVRVACTAAGEAAKTYNFTRAQKRALSLLLDASMDGDWAALLRGPPLQSATALLAALPEDLPPPRRALVQAACDLLGRVPYFWGGKSGTVGWDGRWGVPALVIAPGISECGTVMPYGLDCSGFVSWCAVTALDSPKAYRAIGDGVRNQSSKCDPIDWADALPGDLVFFPDLSHIGIVTGQNADGGLSVIHCARSKGTVVISPDAAALGFTSVGRPQLYNTGL